jgi:hypothetical protein
MTNHAGTVPTWSGSLRLSCDWQRDVPRLADRLQKAVIYLYPSVDAAENSIGPGGSVPRQATFAHKAALGPRSGRLHRRPRQGASLAVFADCSEILRRITNRPGPEGQGRFVVERDQSAGRRRVEEDTRRSGFARRTGREVASCGEAASASEVVSEATDASTTTAENITRARPKARSRTGRPCASRTAGRSCRPDSRAARRPGVAGRRSETRTGTAVASESWADARSHRSRQEGEYGPARQGLLPLIAQSGPLRDTQPPSALHRQGEHCRTRH